MKLKYFIKAKTAEMNKETRTLFYSVIRDVLDDLVTSVKSTDKEGNPVNTKMFHKIVDGSHWYVVPLTKSPSNEQLEKVVDRLANMMNIGDFEVESSLTEQQDVFDNNVSQADYDIVAEQFAQKLHEDWLNDRMQNGWRYGEQRNDEQRTHPLVKNWSQLSDRDKSIKPQLVTEFVNILKSNGFKITKK